MLPFKYVLWTIASTIYSWQDSNWVHQHRQHVSLPCVPSVKMVLILEKKCKKIFFFYFYFYCRNREYSIQYFHSFRLPYFYLTFSLSLSYLHTYTNMYSTYPISFTHSIPLSHKYTHIQTCIVHLIYSFYTSLTLSQTCIVQILSHLLYLSLSYLNTLFKPLSYT